MLVRLGPSSGAYIGCKLFSGLPIFSLQGLFAVKVPLDLPVYQANHVVLHSRQVHAAGSQHVKGFPQQQLHMGPM